MVAVRQTLGQVTEVRVLVSAISDIDPLFLADFSIYSVPSAVFYSQRDVKTQSQDSNQASKRTTESTTLRIKRRIFVRKDRGADQTRALPKDSKHGHSCTFLALTSLIVQHPCNIDRQCRKDSTCCKPDPGIPGRSLRFILNTRQYKVPRCTHSGKESDHIATVSPTIRYHCGHHAADEGSKIRRSREALSFDRSITQSLHDCRQKVGQTREGIVAAEMDRHVDIVFVVHQTTDNLLPLQFALCRPINGLQTLNSLGLLGLVQKFGTSWGIWEEEEDHNGEQDRWRTLWESLVFEKSNKRTNLPMMKRYRHGFREPFI